MSPAKQLTNADHDRLRELLPWMELEEQQHVARVLAAQADPRARSTVGLYPVPIDWRERLTAIFPKHVAAGFARRHVEYWEHINRVSLQATPDPLVAIWPRGGGKSTGCELAVADLGCRDRRRYFLYVRETQEQADKSVQNVAALLESPAIADYYPHHANRALSKYGQSKGWKRERLTTAGGLVIDAVGLDTATRGLKFEEQRPDCIILDDIDGKFDSPATTQKKEDIITHSILPAGSNNCFVLFVQNLIIPDGVCSRLATGKADYLATRRVSGPFEAVQGLKYEWKIDPATSIRRALITAGKATWAGQPLAACQQLLERIGLAAFLKECQQKVRGRTEGAVLRFRPHDEEDEETKTVAPSHYIDLTDDECRQLVREALHSKGISLFGGIDFGAWRFAFTLWVVTRSRVVIRIDEYFAQRVAGQAGLAERARAIHETMEWYGIPVAVVDDPDAPKPRVVPIWGDSANPTDMYEMNVAWKTGWMGDDGQWVTSRLRVVATMPDGKLRKTAVDRMNNLLDQNQLRFRRGVSYEWHLGANAGNPEGVPQVSSRLVWEMENWSYGMPKPGETQDQDPDDATADGADMMASSRYAIMSHFQATKLPAGAGHHDDDRTAPIDYRGGKFKPIPHMADLLSQGGRKLPRVRMPRPRGR